LSVEIDLASVPNANLTHWNSYVLCDDSVHARALKQRGQLFGDFRDARLASARRPDFSFLRARATRAISMSEAIGTSPLRTGRPAAVFLWRWHSRRLRPSIQRRAGRCTWRRPGSERV